MGATRECLAELDFLSATAAFERREDILRRVTDLFLLTVDRQHPDDTAVFDDVMCRLAAQVDLCSRVELARRVAAAPRAPGRLVRLLAADDIEVARPLLELSPALTDAELIALARNGSLAHGDAISRRVRLTAPLTDVLLEQGDDVLLTQIAANPNAAVSPAGFERLAARAAGNGELRQTLMERADLPAAIAVRLSPPRSAGADAPDWGGTVEWVIEPAPGAPAAAGEPATAPDAPSAPEGDEARLAALARDGKLDASIAALADLTGLPGNQVENCLLSAEMPALVVLCKAHGLSEATFSALLQLRHAAGAITTKGIASAMRRYDTMDRNMAQRIMRFLKVRLARPGDVPDDGLPRAAEG